MIELFLLGGMGASEEAISAIRKHLSDELGEPMKANKAVNPAAEETNQHKEGIAKLRALKARMTG